MTDSADSLNALDGERGIPSVNTRRAASGLRRKLMAFTFVLACCGLAAVMFAVFRSARAQAEDDKQVKELTPSRPPQKKTFDFRPPPPSPASEEPPAAGTGGEGLRRPPVAGEGPGASPAAEGVDRAASPLMVASAGTGGAEKARGRASFDSGGTGSGALDGMLVSSQRNASRAHLLQNRDYLLTAGAMIKCGQMTRLDSTVGGFASCLVSRDVYSYSGKVVLIPRGSRAVAEYRAGALRGSKRIFVLYTHIDTPDGVRIPLNSPGTDALGASGIEGHVDDHFWLRFGGAIMLSLIDDVAEAASNALDQGKGQRITFTNTSEGMSSAAAEAIRGTINIPPTIYVSQGAEISIFVARDLDFSDVYELTADEGGAGDEPR
ncbi:MAG: type IV secretion system protein VirB10 [Azoarcus sp.]|jgi:type IV secretion system protein VirB10|nr:type IV secretion system protein VirB10 [Azoarcus sp.]